MHIIWPHVYIGHVHASTCSHMLVQSKKVSPFCRCSVSESLYCHLQSVLSTVAYCVFGRNGKIPHFGLCIGCFGVIWMPRDSDGPHRLVGGWQKQFAGMVQMHQIIRPSFLFCGMRFFPLRMIGAHLDILKKFLAIHSSHKIYGLIFPSLRVF